MRLIWNFRIYFQLLQMNHLLLKAMEQDTVTLGELQQLFKVQHLHKLTVQWIESTYVIALQAYPEGIVMTSYADDLATGLYKAMTRYKEIVQ
jgi:hypothetical protein